MERFGLERSSSVSFEVLVIILDQSVCVGFPSLSWATDGALNLYRVAGIGPVAATCNATAAVMPAAKEEFPALSNASGRRSFRRCERNVQPSKRFLCTKPGKDIPTFGLGCVR